MRAREITVEDDRYFEAGGFRPLPGFMGSRAVLAAPAEVGAVPPTLVLAVDPVS